MDSELVFRFFGKQAWTCYLAGHILTFRQTLMSHAEIQSFRIPSQTIFSECRIYQQWQQLYLKKDVRYREIALPGLKDTGTLQGLTGCFLHTTLVILRFAAALSGFYRLQEWAAQKRLQTDSFSFEPEACGAHEAFTSIGLARVKVGDIQAAIQSLKASCRVHPCPHTTSFGLRRSLRDALLAYPEAKEAVEEYDSFAREFGGKRYWESLKH